MRFRGLNDSTREKQRGSFQRRLCTSRESCNKQEKERAWRTQLDHNVLLEAQRCYTCYHFSEDSKRRLFELTNRRGQAYQHVQMPDAQNEGLLTGLCPYGLLLGTLRGHSGTASACNVTKKILTATTQAEAKNLRTQAAAYKDNPSV